MRELRLRKVKVLGKVTQPGSGEARIWTHPTLNSFFILLTYTAPERPPAPKGWILVWVNSSFMSTIANQQEQIDLEYKTIALSELYEGFHLMSLFFLLLCSFAVDFWKLCVEEKQIGRSSRGKERMTGLTGWFKGPCFVFHFFLLQLNSVTFHYLFWFSPTSIFLSPNKKYDFFFFNYLACEKSYCQSQKIVDFGGQLRIFHI